MGGKAACIRVETSGVGVFAVGASGIRIEVSGAWVKHPALVADKAVGIGVVKTFGVEVDQSDRKYLR